MICNKRHGSGWNQTDRLMRFIIITTDNIEIFLCPFNAAISRNMRAWWGTSSQNGNGFTDHPSMTCTIIKNNTQQTLREA
jgi:hypothetical protein